MDVFRKEYKRLSDDQESQMELIKVQAEKLLASFEIKEGERSEKSRCMAIARTNLEQAIMWAIKGVTYVE